MRGNIAIPELPFDEEVWLTVSVTSVRQGLTQQGKPFRDVRARNSTGSVTLKIWAEALEGREEIRPVQTCKNVPITASARTNLFMGALDVLVPQSNSKCSRGPKWFQGVGQRAPSVLTVSCANRSETIPLPKYRASNNEVSKFTGTFQKGARIQEQGRSATAIYGYARYLRFKTER
jgi:hypothetical protein